MIFVRFFGFFVIEQHAISRRIQIVVLSVAQGPDVGGNEAKGNEKGKRKEEVDYFHLIIQNDNPMTDNELIGMSMAANSGPTAPATATETPTML